jgi:radical SAM protein with 4Fe4S-binding SPASM domain
MTERPPSRVLCSKPWTSFELEHDGRVAPCCMSKIDCGNVNQQSVAEIWNGPAYQEFRRSMAAGEWRKTCRPECPRLQGPVDDSVGAPQGDAFKENYRLNLAEIERGDTVLRSWPRIWKITASTRCNLDCIMCYQDRDDLRSLPPSFYEQLEPMFACMQEAQILGGEPFAVRTLRSLMRDFPSARFPDARFAIMSNGTIHDDRTVELVRTLRMSWMSISLDAATEATYAHIRRGGNFMNALEGAKRWIELGRECGFTVHIAFTVMKDNVRELPQFARLAAGLGVDALFGRVFGDKGDQREIDREALRQAIVQTRAIIAPPAKMPLANLTLAAIAS